MNANEHAGGGDGAATATAAVATRPWRASLWRPHQAARSEEVLRMAGGRWPPMAYMAVLAAHVRDLPAAAEETLCAAEAGA